MLSGLVALIHAGNYSMALLGFATGMALALTPLCYKLELSDSTLSYRGGLLRKQTISLDKVWKYKMGGPRPNFKGDPTVALMIYAKGQKAPAMVINAKFFELQELRQLFVALDEMIERNKAGPKGATERQGTAEKE